jgi:flagellar assembly factor FliW
MHPTVSSNATPDNPALAGAPESQSIVTRFGELTIDADKIITFSDGLYGLEQHRRYMLVDVPDWPGIFKLLQAVDDPQLSLIVLPLEGVDGPIDPADFAEACSTLAFDEEVTTALGVVTMRADGEGQTFTVNLKAPLLIDAERRQGRQHVFASEKYRLRHPIPAAEGEEA